MNEPKLKEVLKIQKKLQKIMENKDYGQAQQLIVALGKMSITLDVLIKTRVGLTVNSLRKAIRDDEETCTLAKDLVKKWKRLMDNGNGSTNGTNSAKEDRNHSNPGSGSNSNDSTSQNSNSGMKKSTPPTTTAKAPSSYSAGDASGNEVRIKCREMLSNALKVALPEGTLSSEEIDLGDLGDADEIAEQIESIIFKEFKSTEMKYKNRIRSRVSNLRDNRNPDLRLNVLRGLIKPERIAKMDSTEMASDEMKQLRDKITKEMIQEHQISLSGGTQTDLIKCPKCKKTNVTYNQVQTRSADEPMTTFCLCNECGKRWKFC